MQRPNYVFCACCACDYVHICCVSVQSVRGMLENPTEAVNELSYFDCIDSVMENSKVEHTHTSHFIIAFTCFSHLIPLYLPSFSSLLAIYYKATTINILFNYLKQEKNTTFFLSHVTFMQPFSVEIFQLNSFNILKVKY